MHDPQAQTEMIRTHLISGARITPIEALNFYNCLRLGARIYDLRREGLPIQARTKTLKNGKRVAEYFLLEQTIQNLKQWQLEK